MRIRKRLSVPLLLVAALTAYALFNTPAGLIQDPVPTASEGPAPDAYASGVSLRAFSEAGILLERTDARELRRFDGPGRVELDAPQRWSFDAQGSWFAVSQQGELFEHRDVLELRGDVELRYESRSVTFATEGMIIHLDKQTARSTSAVRAWQDDERSEMRADTLFADLDRRVAILNGNVRSVYVPEN